MKFTTEQKGEFAILAAYGMAANDVQSAMRVIRECGLGTPELDTLFEQLINQLASDAKGYDTFGVFDDE